MKRVLLTFVLSLFVVVSAWAKPLIVFDAGSSGTRVYVYDAQADKVTQLHSYKVKPGLSALDPSDAVAFDQYFADLVKSTESVLDEAARSTTPMHLYATAGMRMLPADEQEAIFAQARTALTKQAALLGYPEPAELRAISGTEEGVFIWLSDNYAAGKLDRSMLTPANTVAALEMGGASSEIAYLSKRAKKHTIEYYHFNQMYPIYGFGYDGFGADKAIATMHASAHPGFAACFPVGAPYPLNSGEITGAGDMNTCVKAIQDVMIDRQTVSACEADTPGECSGFGEYQPKAGRINQYFLTSAFYYLFDTLGIANKSVEYADFIKAGQQYCSADWETVQANYPGDPAYLISYCFNAALTQTLLDGWHLAKHDKLTATGVVNDKVLEWPVGAALWLSN